MKRFKKLLSAVLAGTVISIFFLHPAMAQEVTVYGDSDYPPYSFVKDGKAAGIYADIFKKAFSRMKGYEVTIKLVPWKRGLNLMKEGRGFALYPPYYRPKVRPFMDYPVPVLQEGYAMLTANDMAGGGGKKWPEDFANLKIGINAGYSIPDVDKAKGLGIQIIEAASTRSNLLKLAHGRQDGYVSDKNAMLWGLKQLKDKGEYDPAKHKELVVAMDISKEFGYLGFTNKAEFSYKADFIKQFTNVINQMKDSGEIQAILESYIK